MNLMGLFRSPENELEKGGKPVPEEDAGIRTACPHCGVQLPLNDLQDNLQVCTACGYHFRMGPRDRIVYLADEDSFSELVTGIDIVKWQIRIAAGVPLDFTQEDIHVQGAAIECRINAKGPGKVGFFHTPGGPWVRFDTFLYQGYEIPPYYDSMLGKMIVYSSTREEAIRKMQSALCELVVGGTCNNIEDQIEIIRDERFKKGDYYTDFMKTFPKGP